MAQQFSAQDKVRTTAIMSDIESAMGRDIEQLDTTRWSSQHVDGASSRR